MFNKTMMLRALLIGTVMNAVAVLPFVDGLLGCAEPLRQS